METQFIIKKRNHIKTTVVVLVIISILALIYDVNRVYTKEQDEILEGLSNSLIRFHVIANSDTEEDQALKIKVKDAVVIYMQQLLEQSNSIDESREIILEDMDHIKAIADEVIKQEGSIYPTTISLAQENFPLKKYGDVVLPPGQYEALVIRIGKAEGKNWWCVLFPPLCFVDATHGVVDDKTKEQMQEVLTDEEYKAIIMNKDQQVDIKIKSKFLEWYAAKEKETMFANLFK